MGKIPMIIPVTEMRQEAATALEQARETGEPIVITQRGRAAAVLLSVEAYERMVREREVFHAIMRGEQEIAKGEGFDLEDVLAEIDEMLSKREP